MRTTRTTVRLPKRFSRGHRQRWASLPLGALIACAGFALIAVATTADAQSWSTSLTTSAGGVHVQDMQDAYSPGNLHFGLYPINLHWGRTTNLNAGAVITWEAPKVIALQASAFYPYYSFGKDDRSQGWYQFEGILMLHGRSDHQRMEEFTLSSDSTSTQYGDYLYTQSNRRYVNLPARHRVYRGARLGVLATRTPAKLHGTTDAPDRSLFADSTHLIGVAGYHATDARDRHVYVSQYGVRGSTWWTDFYADFLVDITRTYADITPDKDPSLFGFRLGVQQLYGRNAGMALRAEGGLMPGAGGWYGQVGIGFGSNVWAGREY